MSVYLFPFLTCQIHRSTHINNDTNKAYEHNTIPVTAKSFPLEFNPMAPKIKPTIAMGDTATRVIVHAKQARISVILIMPNVKEMAPLLKPTSKLGIFYARRCVLNQVLYVDLFHVVGFCSWGSLPKPSSSSFSMSRAALG